MQRRSNLRLPELRLSSLQPRIDLDDPQRFAGPLQFFFYLLLFVALLAIFAGATGTGVVMLIAAATLHVVRSSLEEVAAQRRARRERNQRKRQVRLRSHRARRVQQAAEPRVAASPALAPRRRPAVARPSASSTRQQRVI